MTTGHEPNPEFISGLESQLASGLRRQQSFGSIGLPGKSARISKTAVLFVLCVAVGVTAAKTVEHIETSRQKALLLARAETTIELLQSRQSVAREVVERVEERVEAGLLHSKELEEAVSRSVQLDHELDKAYLDLDEVHLTGQGPRDELHAPLQDGRDFVTERLQVEYRVVSATVEPIASRRARMMKLVEAGLAHPSQMDQIDLELERVDQQLEDIQNRLDLRAAFLSGELTAKQTAMLRMLYGARARLRASVNEEESAVAQLERISRAEANGLASPLDVKRAESRLVSVRAEQRLAAIELELLEQELGEGESP